MSLGLVVQVANESLWHEIFPPLWSLSLLICSVVYRSHGKSELYGLYRPLDDEI